MRLRGLWLLELKGLPAPFLWRTDVDEGSEQPGEWGYEDDMETEDWMSDPPPMFGGMSTAFLAEDNAAGGHGEAELADDDATPEASDDEEEVSASGSEEDDDHDENDINDKQASRDEVPSATASETCLLFDDTSLLSKGLASLTMNPS